MPPAAPLATASGTAATANSCSTGTLTRTYGPYGWVYVFVAYNGNYLDNPVQTVDIDGGDAGQFIAAQTGSAGVVSCELWAIPYTSTVSGAINVSFGAGPSLSIIVDAMEVACVGLAEAPNISANGSTGVIGPASNSLTSSNRLGGRGGIQIIPVADNAIIGMGASGGATGSLNLSVGTSVNGISNVGTGGAHIWAGTAWVQATGGADSLEWIVSGSDGWSIVMADIPGAAISDVIQEGRTIPVPF